MSWTDGAESACRDFVVDGEGNVCRVTGYMTDCLSEDTDKVPLQTHTLKEFEQHLNDLKKENFSLKLRIYFLEERIQQKFEDGGDDVYRTNIELKVEVESLKQELQEKQKLLDKALTTAESLTNHNEEELQRHCEERQQEIHHMQEVLESRIQILQEEARIARDEAERMASLDESPSQHPSVAMETVPKETSGDWSPQSDEDADRHRIEQLSAALCRKERLIRELTEERTDLRQRLRLMEEQLQTLTETLLQRERDAQFYEEELGRERLRVQQEMQTLMEEQTQTLQFDHSAGQCVAQLQNAQMQVEALQTQIHHSETSNKKLQEKVSEMESELQSIRQAAQNQQRTIQNLTDSLRTKDTETQELYHVIEDQKNTLCKLTETHQQQPQHGQALDGAVESSSLLEAHHTHTHTHTLTQRRLEDLKRSRDRLQDQLRDAEEHRETTHTHNQDLCETLERLRSELRVKVCELRDREAETHSDISDRDETIIQLQKSLCRKHTLLQEYSELLNSSGASERDTLLHTLRSRIRDRDAALERSIDEKFLCLEEKDAEVHRLQLMLREKDRDLERLRCVLNNTNDTVTGLDALVRSKELELERTLEMCRKLEWMKQQSDEKHTIAVRERDGVIQRLQTALHTHSKETEELRSVLLGKLSVTDVLQELQAHLSTRERLFQEVMSEHSLRLQEHHTHLTELLDTISSRDQEMKDYGERLGRVISERSAQLQELRRQLSSREQELHDVNRERERDFPAARELKRLQNVLKEKDSLIQEFLQGPSSTAAERAVCTSSSGDLEIQAIRDELQLTLRKQRETERELSELRSLLASRHHDTLRSDQQCVLQQLVSEQKVLNEALRAEKSLYQSLRGVQSPADSSAEKTRVLDEQLNSLQALRELLGHTLETSRHTALAMERHTLQTERHTLQTERAARVQDEYGESSSDEDDEDPDSSDEDEEFTDSIEDNDITLTAQSLTSAQRAEEGGRPLMSHNASEGVRCDEVERNQDECKMVGVTVQDEDSSLTHVRNTPDKHPALDHRECGAAATEEVCVRSRGLEKCEADRRNSHEPQRDYRTCSEEEEDESDEEDGEEDVRVPLGKRGPPCVKLRESRRKRRCTRPHSLDLGALLSHTPAAQDEEREVEGDSNESSDRGGGAVGFWQHVEAGLREQAERLRSDLAVSRQESRELQERLMVSEATVHAQAEQLNDYRELLTESAVQRDSKQVQVDLQDLGYETSGRSENEAEREEASSPEFDELEMCGSPSVTRNQRCGWHGDNDAAQTDDPSSLKCLVQDLRAQLSRCHKVIRGLQLRMRSLSTTSDYASSLERTPRKVNWAFEALEEDEGWQSDGPLRPSREMRELVTRVALLETQIQSKSQEDGRCATWPGKYNTLIQAQARELSHLRQKMREGRGICHILTQHLSDTTKAFEELLRANDIDYYMSQSFREQLSQSSSLAQRVSTKISGRDRSEQRDDKAGHELLALRLSKELQHKDQIIESLHTQLQKRSDTPCSSHAPSETTDQSDCISFVSDERGSTNEELCSDSEFAQEAEPETKDGAFSATHSLSSYQLAAHMPVSHHALGKSEGPSVQTDALWDMENMIQPIRGFNGSSYYQSGNSQSGVDVIEEHLREIRSLRQRLEDSIRTNERLRQQLQGRLSTARDTAAPTNIFIQSHGTVSQLTNEIRALKEENLALQSRIQASRDSSEEVKTLKEAVLSGRVRLQQAELEAELEAGQWKEELRRLQMHNCEQSQQIQQLRQDRQNCQEHNNRLQHEVSLLQQQLADSRQLLHSLQSELQLYNQVCVSRKSTAAGCVCEVAELQELLVEVRALRVQLEVSVQENSSLRAQLQKLDHSSDQRRSPIVPASPLRDVLYRRLVLHDPSPSPPVRDVGPFPAGPLYSPYSEMEETNDSLEPQADLEGEAPDGSFAHSNGRHAVGHVDDHGALQQQVLEARVLVQRMEAALTESLDSALMEKALDYSTVKALLSDTKTLRQILDEAVSLLKMFWRAALPSSDGPVHLLQREQSMREEIQVLRLRIAQQEEVLQGTITRLRSTSRTKESMETFIVNQLSRTRDVLKKARANLENELRISSLSSSSSSLCHGKAISSARVSPACPETSLQRPAQRVREFVQLTVSR